jgi:ribonucleoside-triphosphate reductase
LSKSEDNFFARLDRLLTLAKNSLEIKRKIIEKLTEQDLYPYSKFYLKDVKKRFGFYWKNHFSTIGIIGMNEALLNFKGVSIAEQEGKEFALKTLKYIKSKLLSFQEETGNLYNLEATPAEGTSFRLALIDKKKFPAIICSNEKNFIETGVPFYTNSSQAPVDFYDDIFSLLDNQDDLQAEYTGGTVQHIYIGEKIENIFSLKKFIKTVFQNYKLPYISITPTFSICPNCGYFPGEIQKCKVCENEMEIYSRIVGYIRPLQNWNDGKQEEFKLRKTFKLQ